MSAAKALAGAEVAVRIGRDLVLHILPGERLIDLCDARPTPLLFGCRGASCGTCAVAVLDGLENLSPRSEAEEILLAALFPGADRVRLACQLVIHGPVHLEPHEE